MTFKTVEQEITPILEEHEVARCDDMALYAAYVYKKIQRYYEGPGWLERVFSDRRFRISCGIVPYETISRIRRKLQSKNEELRPTKEYQEERKKAENEYKKYAKDKAEKMID